jgi:hypothetical protein
LRFATWQKFSSFFLLTLVDGKNNWFFSGSGAFEVVFAFFRGPCSPHSRKLLNQTIHPSTGEKKAFRAFLEVSPNIDRYSFSPSMEKILLFHNVTSISGFECVSVFPAHHRKSSWESFPTFPVFGKPELSFPPSIWLCVCAF